MTVLKMSEIAHLWESEKAFDTDVIIYIKEQIGFAEFTDF